MMPVHSSHLSDAVALCTCMCDDFHLEGVALGCHTPDHILEHLFFIKPKGPCEVRHLQQQAMFAGRTWAASQHLSLLLWGMQQPLGLTPGFSSMRARRLAPQLMSFRLKPQPKTPPPPTYRVPVTTSQPWASWTLHVMGLFQRVMLDPGAMCVPAVGRTPDLIISGIYLGCRHGAEWCQQQQDRCLLQPTVTASSLHRSHDGTGLRP